MSEDVSAQAPQEAELETGGPCVGDLWVASVPGVRTWEGGNLDGGIAPVTNHVQFSKATPTSESVSCPVK